MTVDLCKTILVVLLLMAVKDLLIFAHYDYIIEYKVMGEIRKLIDSIKTNEAEDDRPRYF